MARIAFHADASFCDALGFHVVAIEENEPGYWIFDTCDTLEDAKRQADRENAVRGLDPITVIKIRTSSMAAHWAKFPPETADE